MRRKASAGLPAWSAGWARLAVGFVLVAALGAALAWCAPAARAREPAIAIEHSASIVYQDMATEADRVCSARLLVGDAPRAVECRQVERWAMRRVARAWVHFKACLSLRWALRPFGWEATEACLAAIDRPLPAPADAEPELRHLTRPDLAPLPDGVLEAVLRGITPEQVFGPPWRAGAGR